jgi:hypothetical protein
LESQNGKLISKFLFALYAKLEAGNLDIYFLNMYFKKLLIKTFQSSNQKEFCEQCNYLLDQYYNVTTNSNFAQMLRNTANIVDDNNYIDNDESFNDNVDDDYSHIIQNGKHRHTAALAALRRCTTYLTNVSFLFFFSLYIVIQRRNVPVMQRHECQL